MKATTKLSKKTRDRLKKARKLDKKKLRKEKEPTAHQVAKTKPILSIHPKLRFGVVNKNTSQSFQKAFEQALAGVNEHYFDALPKEVAIFLSKMCHGSFDTAIMAGIKEYFRGKLKFGQRYEPNENDFIGFQQYCVDQLGDHILTELSKEMAVHLIFPQHDFYPISFDDRRIVYKLQKLQEVCIENQLLHTSPYQHRPTVKGEIKQLLYSKHLLERITTRMSANHHSWGSNARVFEYLCHLRYFETTPLSTGQVSLILYDQPKKAGDFFSDRLSQVDDSLRTTEGKCYILGYIPIAEHENHFIGKTILFPGMRGTPEFDLIKNSGLPSEKKKDFLTSFENISQLKLYEDESTLEAYRWIHENGCPQTKVIGEDIFCFEDDEKLKIFG